ncbi:hypothetical protein QQF64_034741 [Cirrhinus molitorella]|uniref:Uncharacterized protein n=1 Tax=Cirrhinus molitorella TaxID=172907 RepID=A0ABR3L1V7_9TELE
MRCVAIRGLPVLLGDDPTKFFKACFFQMMETHINMCEDVALQPLSFCLHPSSMGIILKGNVVMVNLDNIPQATVFCLA